MTNRADAYGPREAVVGKSGRIVTPTRGAAGPGEAEFAIRGGTEVFIARSSTPLARGTTVIAVSLSGARAVEVVPFADPSDELLDLNEGV